MSAFDPKRTFGLGIVAPQNDGRTPRDSYEQTRSNQAKAQFSLKT